MFIIDLVIRFISIIVMIIFLSSAKTLKHGGKSYLMNVNAGIAYESIDFYAAFISAILGFCIAIPIYLWIN